MKKLDKLPKRVDYKVPDGYFDQLPLRIQNRIGASQRRDLIPSFGWVARYAIPLIIALAVGILWFQQTNNTLIDQLEKIDTDQLSFFIEDPDLTSEELSQAVTWTADDLDALELEVYDVLDASADELDVVVDELDLENL